MVDELSGIAASKGVSTAQLALAWVLSRGEDIVPIPGTKRRKYLEDNAHAATIEFGPDELRAIEAAIPQEQVQGPRFPGEAMKRVNN